MQYMIRSSAKSEPFMLCGRLSRTEFIAIRKHVELRTPPCGVPVSVGFACEYVLPILTLVFGWRCNFL